MNAATITSNPMTSLMGLLPIAAGLFHLFTLISTHATIQPADYEFLMAMFGAGGIGLAASDGKTVAAAK